MIAIGNRTGVGGERGGGGGGGEGGGGGVGGMVVWSFCPKLRGGGGDRLFYCARAVFVVPVDLVEVWFCGVVMVNWVVVVNCVM